MSLHVALIEPLHALDVLFGTVVGNGADCTTSHLHCCVLLLAQELRISCLSNLGSNTFCDCSCTIFHHAGVDQTFLGLDQRTLLGFNVHQLTHQGLQLHICKLAGIGLGHTLTEESQHVGEPTLQALLKRFFPTKLPDITLCRHLKHLVETLMGQTQGSKPSQVIRTISVVTLQVEHEVVLTLGMGLLRRCGHGPITLEEVRTVLAELVVHLRVQVVELAVGDLGLCVVAIQGSFDRGLNLLDGKGFLFACCHVAEHARTKGSNT